MRPSTRGTMDTTERGRFGVHIGDSAIGKLPPFDQEWLEYWQNASNTDPDGAMNAILCAMNTVRDRKPFRRRIWTELAEIGRKILPRVSPRFRNAFLRVTSHDRERQIDMLQVCHTRVTIFEMLAQRNPTHALRAIVKELGTLPYEDTFVASQNGKLLASVSLTEDQGNLCDIYRLHLEQLYAALVLKTGKGTNRDIILWGIMDIAQELIQKSLEDRDPCPQPLEQKTDNGTEETLSARIAV